MITENQVFIHVDEFRGTVIVNVALKPFFSKKMVTNIWRMASRNHQLTDANVGTHLPPIKVPAARFKEEMIPADLAEIIERSA